MKKKSSTGHLELIRRINRSLILNMVKEKQPISRAQMAKALGLSKTTVSSIVDELIQKRLIVEYGDACTGTGAGRPSIMLGFNPKSSYCIGVDMASAKTRMLLTDLSGEILFEKKIATVSQIDQISQAIEAFLAEHSIRMEMIFGMGVGVSGDVTAEGVVISSRAFRWNHLPFQALLKQRFPFPVYVGNGVNLAALGERWLGSGKQVDDMVYVRIGSGIGGALICNGQLVLGTHGSAGEMGYFLESRDLELGSINQKGIPGVLERKCSGTALARYGCSPEELFSSYSQGNPEVVLTVERFIREISVAIANAVSLLNPAKVVIGGDISEYMAPVIQRIQDEVRSMTPIQTDISLACLGGRAAALGAVDFVMTRIEQEDIAI